MIKSRLAKICLSYAVAFATSTGVLLADTSLSTMTCNDIFAIKQYQSQHFLRELAFSPGYVDGFLPETMEVKGDRSAFRALVKLFVQKTKHLYHGVEKQKVSDRVTDSAQVFLPGQWHTVLVLKDSMRVIEKYNFLTTKHLALAKSGEAVRFAGEIFLDGDGTIYLSNDSGTFQPTVAQLHAMTAMMREIFPKAKIVEVPYLEQGAFEKSVATSIAKETVGQEYNLFDANIDMQLASKLDGQKISGMRILRYALKKSTSYVTEKKDRPDIVAVTEKEYKITGEMPLDLNQLTFDIETVINNSKYRPYVGSAHEWTTNTLKYFKKMSWFVPDKLLLLLYKGRTHDYMPTGLENSLRQRMLTYQDGSIQPIDVFRESYELCEGNLYKTMLLAENVLAYESWRNDRATFNPIFVKLAYIRKDSKPIGDNYGAWYHLFGTALYSLVRPYWKAKMVSNTDTIFSSRIMGPRDQQEEIFNALGTELGRRLRELSCRNECPSDAELDSSRVSDPELPEDTEVYQVGPK